MTRIIRMISGVLLIAVQIALLILRFHAPLSDWAPSGSLQGLVLLAVSSGALLGGTWLIAHALPADRVPSDQTGSKQEPDQQQYGQVGH